MRAPTLYGRLDEDAAWAALSPEHRDTVGRAALGLAYALCVEAVAETPADRRRWGAIRATLHDRVADRGAESLASLAFGPAAEARHG